MLCRKDFKLFVKSHWPSIIYAKQDPKKFPNLLMVAAMAEWLRRLTRNQMGSSRVGSNPTRSAPFARVAKYTSLYAHFNEIT